MIEIERKFRLSPKRKKEIEQELQRSSGPLYPKHQIDEVFLNGIDSFDQFKQGMPVTRLRTENGATHLAYKRRINTAGDMVEHEVAVSSADVMRLILIEMGYRSVTCVEKVRLEAKASGMTVVLDSVTGLGDFLEIEVIAKDKSSLADAERRIMARASEFGLTDADIEPRKYDLLLAQPTR